ncbi:uncharacterized protein CDAR_8321 [Caerostris darwini]|uniref:Uncharacterized protein n=1 Tax=Caerostris darwini TaxID=1538125 RepID=A0AAV4T557_9ARAC|nr:uncharacterized protein CDAR_8321 [Caerostris darwini]
MPNKTINEKGDLENVQKESKNDQKESGDVQEKTENYTKESVTRFSETIFDTENNGSDFEHMVAETEEPESKPSDSQDASKKSKPSKNIVVKLDQSLNNKLAKKRAVADELEDKLQNLRVNFESKFLSVERIKQELKRRETKLLRSVRKIEKYMRDIYSLKREADDMYEKINANAIEQGLHFTMLSEECDDVLSKTTFSNRLLQCYTPAKACLRDIVCDIQNLGNEKKVVEYYLILQMLRQDLLEEDKKCITEAQDFTNERRNTSERLRTHPLKILEKENIIQNINNETKDIRSKNIELEQQVSNLFSAKVKDELTWYNIQRWININYQTICEIMPPDIDEPKETYLDKLQKMETFVVMGHQIIERYNKERK